MPMLGVHKAFAAERKNLRPLKRDVRRTCLLHLLMDHINMNIFVLIVACFSLLAVIAHVIGGTKETASIAPDENNILLSHN
jgi:hypothetical protein